MLSCDDVIWEHSNDSAEKLSKDKDASTIRKNSHRKKKKVLENKSENLLRAETSDIDGIGKEKTVNSGGVTLKDLSQEDKQKIAELIKELAKVGEEKENVIHVLNDERQKFFSQVIQLEEEKKVLRNKQQFLAEEVKQCQTLLQYYQNLITMQQSSLIAQEESKRQMDITLSTKSPKKTSCIINDNPHLLTSNDEHFSQSDEIEVNEVDGGDTSSINSSLTEDDLLRMNDNQYRLYLRRKKERLKKEQESLQKLLILKAADSEQEFTGGEIFPVRDDQQRHSDGRSRKISKRSVPVHTISPAAVKESTSYLSPSRATSNETGIYPAGHRREAVKTSVHGLNFSPAKVEESMSYLSPTRTSSNEMVIHLDKTRQNNSKSSGPGMNLSPTTVKESTSYLTPSRPRFSQAEIDGNSSYTSPYLSASNETHVKSKRSSHSSEILKHSMSPEKILELLSQDIEDLQDNLSHSYRKPSMKQGSNLSVSYSDSVSVGTISCDDSQLLQDIFFV